jgi:hypothetical protein
MSFLLKDDYDLRFGDVVKNLNEKHNFNIKRNSDDKSLFKWIDDKKLIHIAFCTYKTLIPILFKYIKEGIKNECEMSFIFIDERHNIIYKWDYNDKDVIIGYNYSENGSDIEYIMVFNSQWVNL